MKSKRVGVIVLGIFSVWPFVYVLLFLGIVFATALGEFWGIGAGETFPLPAAIFFSVHLLTMLEIFILLVIYLVYLFKTDRVAQDKKALWAVVLFMGHMIAMPIFWYLYMWREPVKKPPIQATSSFSE